MLIAHMGSGYAAEITATLTIFRMIIKENGAERLRPFVVFLKSMIDYMNSMELNHVKLIYDIFVALVFEVSKCF